MTNSSISKTWTLLDALSAKGKSKVGKGEQRMLEERNGLLVWGRPSRQGCLEPGQQSGPDWSTSGSHTPHPAE